MAATRRLAAIMFTDMVGYTASTQADESGTLKRLQEEQELVRPLFTQYQGREIKSTGDGFLVEFDSALKATQCAIEIQRRLSERNSKPGVVPVELRIGIHLGDVEQHGDDVFGDAVNIASRVESLAEPGGACVSQQVFDQVRNKIPNALERVGPKTLKGIRDPLEAYRIVLPWGAPKPISESLIPPRLAVLPLTNISPDPKDEYFADGLTEELITVISQVRGLRVISRTSVGQYKATTKAVAQIGAELGVGSVLEGSVRKAGDQLRITVQLIDVRTDEHRWAQTYDRKLDNVFAIQADVAERTAGALKVELLKPEREALRERPTANSKAYEHYLRGLRAYQDVLATQVSDEAEAVGCFEAAIREDPEFSAPYAYLANLLLGVMGITRPAHEVVPRARELGSKALELSPNSSHAHTAIGNLAFQADLDWDRAEAEFRRAIELNPSNSTAHFWLGYLLVVLQRYAEARDQLKQAMELDPHWSLPAGNLVDIDFYEGNWDSALEASQQLVQNFGTAPWFLGMLAWAYVFLGRTDDALRTIAPLAGVSDVLARQGYSAVSAAVGKPEELRKLLDEWEKGKIPQYISRLGAAWGSAMLGNKEKALRLLEEDLRDGDRTLWNGYQEFVFDFLRDDPRFVAMLRAMKLPLSKPWRRSAFIVKPVP